MPFSALFTVRSTPAFLSAILIGALGRIQWNGEPVGWDAWRGSGVSIPGAQCRISDVLPGSICRAISSKKALTPSKSVPLLVSVGWRVLVPLGSEAVGWGSVVRVPVPSS